MATLAHRFALVVACAIGIPAALAACDGGGETTGTGAAGASTTGGSGGSTSTTGGTAGSGAGIPGGCEPACVEPQICSVAGQCIDPGTCLKDGDCPEGTVCDTNTKTCVPGGGCGGKEAKAEAVAPNLLIVLDRSCSMTQAAGGGTKWEVAVAAIQNMTAVFNGKIRFGLSMFPDLVDPQCQQADIIVPVAPATEMTISDMLGAALQQNDPYFPNGPCVTNIDTAMEQATTEPAFLDPDRDSYVLLITDGKQSSGCSAAGGDNGTTMIIQNLHDMMGVPTFVLGFGNGIDPAQMNTFADAGGVPAGDPTKYYDASDQMSLDAALTTIANKTLGCTFSLDEMPPNPDEIFVFFDNTTKVAKDPTHAMGWDYDPATNQITFYGPTCDSLKAGEITDVDIVFGCDEPTPT
ncbi:MAG: VWA domain-containing protein [Polyangiaceae bacterium]|nr:VWA domain-containing protein [Polyangiaceae bacterium]